MLLSIKNARLAYPHLFVRQKPSIGEGQPKYNGNFLLPKGDPQIAAIQAAMLEVAEAKWPGAGRTVLQSLEASKRCLRDGNNNLDKAGVVRNGFAEHVYISASSIPQPGLFDRVRDPATGKARAITVDDGTLYDGCYVNVHLDIYAMQDGTVRGVYASIRGVQFAGDGERRTAGVSTADEFDATDETAEMPSTPAPTVGALGF